MLKEILMNVYSNFNISLTTYKNYKYDREEEFNKVTNKVVTNLLHCLSLSTSSKSYKHLIMNYDIINKYNIDISKITKMTLNINNEFDKIEKLNNLIKLRIGNNCKNENMCNKLLNSMQYLTNLTSLSINNTTFVINMTENIFTTLLKNETLKKFTINKCDCDQKMMNYFIKNMKLKTFVFNDINNQQYKINEDNVDIESINENMFDIDSINICKSNKIKNKSLISYFK